MRKLLTTYRILEDKMVDTLKSLIGSESQPKRSCKTFLSTVPKAVNHGDEGV
jgi:hypothetical protein